MSSDTETLLEASPMRKTILTIATVGLLGLSSISGAYAQVAALTPAEAEGVAACQVSPGGAACADFLAALAPARLAVVSAAFVETGTLAAVVAANPILADVTPAPVAAPAAAAAPAATAVAPTDTPAAAPESLSEDDSEDGDDTEASPS
jgi:hypothetical protein